MLQEPSTHLIDPATGAMADARGQYDKRLADLTGLYADEAAFDAACAAGGDRIVYSVRDVKPGGTVGDLAFGTTHMEPGRIGAEYFMTRGHIHATANRPETYYGESGQGVMILESPAGESRIMPISARVMIYVPPAWVHRSVNVGSVPLVMTFCYPADSGQDYGIIARSNGMATRIVAYGTGWQAVPNPAYRKRTGAEVAALLATLD